MQPRIDPDSLFAKLQQPLPAPLVPTCTEIRKLLAGGTLAQAKGRYMAGELVRRVAEKSRYGEDGVNRLARELHLDPASLYEYAQVATLWSRDQFLRWMSRRNAAGLPLTWSHFRVLARGMKVAERREQMLQVALENCLSAEDLAREIQHELRIVGAAQRDPLLSGTARMVARVNSLAASAKRWRSTLVPRLTRADPRKVAEATREAHEALESLRDELDAVLKVFEEKGGRKSSSARR